MARRANQRKLLIAEQLCLLPVLLVGDGSPQQSRPDIDHPNAVAARIIQDNNAPRSGAREEGPSGGDNLRGVKPKSVGASPHGNVDNQQIYAAHDSPWNHPSTNSVRQTAPKPIVKIRNIAT